uniref:Ig-like domain-containing protein n=1 Tax=Stegastes partitus TaxID=144197 RepID=A0A3B5APU5_9TELE
VLMLRFLIYPYSVEMLGVHVFQQISSCELDSETGEVHGYRRFGYDGEEFISLDLKTLTWRYTEKASSFKQNWDPGKHRLHFSENLLTDIYLPSVSLLQKTASSPVTCHATGFCPDRADLFWTKDGEELHEDVDKGEILPNHDGSFQMSVDLKVSSIAPEDWKRYNCVLEMKHICHCAAVEMKSEGCVSVTVSPSGFPAGAVIGGVVVLLLLLLLLVLCIAGPFIWRTRYNGTQQHKNSCPAFTFKADIYKNISNKL